MSSKSSRAGLDGKPLPKPAINPYLTIPGDRSVWHEQLTKEILACGREGFMLIDLWAISLGNLGGIQGVAEDIAGKILDDLDGPNGVRTARKVADILTDRIRHNPGFWNTGLGILLIHRGALDFDREYSRIEAARVLGVSPEMVRRMTQAKELRAVGTTTKVTGASLKLAWAFRQVRHSRWQLEEAAVLADSLATDLGV